MKIVLFTDCMSINTQVDEEQRYPALLRDTFPDSEINIVDLGGMTTFESVDSVIKVLEERPALVVYGFGVNDALPRGLKRPTRGAIISWSYRVKMTKQMRLWYRTYFLNPLEYVMQFISQPKHYLTTDETISNIDKCVVLFRENGIKTVLVNIAPVANYRFVGCNKYIQLYNQEIEKYCKDNDIIYVNVFDDFCKIGLKQALGKDNFHYSTEGHKLVAEKLIEIIGKIREQ